MGEAKRRRTGAEYRNPAFDAVGIQLSKELADQGKLIEAGWAAFERFVVPAGAGEVQRREMRLAFMGGAEHVWSSMLAVMDEDREPTARDLKRMELIQKELDEWRKILFERVTPAQGKA